MSSKADGSKRGHLMMQSIKPELKQAYLFHLVNNTTKADLPRFEKLHFQKQRQAHIYNQQADFHQPNSNSNKPRKQGLSVQNHSSQSEDEPCEYLEVRKRVTYPRKDGDRAIIRRPADLNCHRMD